MSTVKTYLVLVQSQPKEDAQWGALLFDDEEETLTELRALGLSVGNASTETHICLPLLAPLTPAQVRGLTALKESGCFTNFYVKDEITAEQHKSIDELRGPA